MTVSHANRAGAEEVDIESEHHGWLAVRRRATRTAVVMMTA